MRALEAAPVGAQVTHLVLLDYLGLLEVIPKLSKSFRFVGKRNGVKIAQKCLNLAQILARYVSDYPSVRLKSVRQRHLCLG